METLWLVFISLVPVYISGQGVYAWAALYFVEVTECRFMWKEGYHCNPEEK